MERILEKSGDLVDKLDLKSAVIEYTDFISACEYFRELGRWEDMKTLSGYEIIKQFRYESLGV